MLLPLWVLLLDTQRFSLWTPTEAPAGRRGRSVGASVRFSSGNAMISLRTPTEAPAGRRGRPAGAPVGVSIGNAMVCIVDAHRGTSGPACRC